MSHLLLKALHLLAVIVFAGGLLVQLVALHAIGNGPLPRRPDDRRLMMRISSWDRMVTAPALLLVWALGMTMVGNGGWPGSWLGLKLLFVALLSAQHGVQAGLIRSLTGENLLPVPRWLQAGPWLALPAIAAVVLLAVLKPL